MAEVEWKRAGGVISVFFYLKKRGKPKQTPAYNIFEAIKDALSGNPFIPALSN